MVSISSSSVSETRAREDRRALWVLDSGIRIKDVGLLDAPVRLNIPPQAVCTPGVDPSEDRGTSEHLRSVVHSNGSRTLVLAPLGLGNHVDHMAVRAAALANCRGCRLGFYEDLPYAMWTSETNIAERVAETAKSSGTVLTPAIIRSERAVWRKWQVIQRYQSQISSEEANRIARFALKYGGGERIWVPPGHHWRSLHTRYAS